MLGLLRNTGMLMALIFGGSLSEAEVKRVLFVKGGPGTGGFLEGGGNDQLADIGDSSTAGGNHGWFELAEALRQDGFTVEQVAEGADIPVSFSSMDLAQYGVVVLGSNNAHYSAADVDAIEDFVRSGGGLLVISDANFGSDWHDAPQSDQLFLSRFGLMVNQDHGTYVLNRANGDFLVSDHPVLKGVDSFDGEGVSPVSLGSNIPGIHREIIVRAKGQLREPASSGAGDLRRVTANDGSLAVALAGGGRVAGHFDRNTFFNLNGAGTSIQRHENHQYALNLFTWLADGERPGSGWSNWEIWRLKQFNERDRANADVSSPSADPDKDGRTNQQEFDSGTDPWYGDAPNVPDPPLALIPRARGNQLIIETQWSSPPNWTALQWQSSGDLKTWQPIEPESHSDGGNRDGKYWFEDSFALTGSTRFIRLSW